MAKARTLTETKIVTTGVELTLTEKEATGLYNLLYRGVGQGVLTDLDLRGVLGALSSAGIRTTYDVRFDQSAQTTAKVIEF
jgi:hypothetical protein